MVKKRKKKNKTKSPAAPIIAGYLEKIGAKVFVDYRNVITELIKGHQGIYALYKKDRLYYVGLATNLRNRIKHHLNDKHQGKWTHFSLYIIRKADHIKELESLVLRISDPKGNSVRGKLSASKNLKRLLKTKLKEEWEKQLNGIIGGKIKAAPKIKKRTKRVKKSRPLKGVFPTGKVIYARYKTKDYKAWVHSNGRIRLNGKRYDTPTAAAKTIIDRSTVNGWNFWKYKDKSGNLVKLKATRK